MMPAAIGSQIRMLRIGQSIASAPQREPADQRGQRNDHRESVVIEVSRLDTARGARDGADRAGAAVHDQAVDQELIADPPEPPAHGTRRAGDDVLVDPVEIVLVREQAIERSRALEQLSRNLRPLQVQEPRDERRSEEHTSELQSRENLVCRLLLEKKKKKTSIK